MQSGLEGSKNAHAVAGRPPVHCFMISSTFAVQSQATSPGGGQLYQSPFRQAVENVEEKRARNDPKNAPGEDIGEMMGASGESRPAHQDRISPRQQP